MYGNPFTLFYTSQKIDATGTVIKIDRGDENPVQPTQDEGK